MVMAAMAGGPEGPEPNTIGLVGDLNEESAQELYHGFMQLNGGKVFPNPVEEGEETTRGCSSSYFNWRGRCLRYVWYH